jgi:DNA-binding response OmpR family regulator
MMLENGPLGRGETILIVDDESITRMMVRKVLEEGGYRVVEADDGDEAVTRAGERMPDLVLLDVRMPRMNGFDTCRSLRELPQGDHVPILMLTGLDDVVAVQLAFDAGATDFITKPINWALLGQRLRYALRTKEQEERLRESESRLAHAQQLARLGQWRYESRNARLSVSSNLAKHLGLTGGPDTLGADVLIRHIHQRDRFKVLRRLLRVWRDGRPLDLEFRLLNAEGRLCTVHLRIERGGDGDEIFLHGTAQDVSARIEAEARISYFSHYDTLTELPNRILFWDRLTHNIADSRRSGNQFAVLLLGLDRFAAINASPGAQRRRPDSADTRQAPGGESAGQRYPVANRRRRIRHHLQENGKRAGPGAFPVPHRGRHPQAHQGGGAGRRDQRQHRYRPVSQ